jgi:hypothetical protein
MAEEEKTLPPHRRLGLDALDTDVRERVEKMMAEAEISEGICAICRQRRKLYSGTCEICFVSWAANTAEAQIRREKGVR